MRGILIILGIIVLVFAAMFVMGERAGEEPGDELPFGMEVVSTGEVVCLPHKDTSGPQTLECAFGLMTEEGVHYGLQNLDQGMIMTGEVSTGSHVTVTGTLVEPEPEQIYDIVGVIEVESVEPMNMEGMEGDMGETIETRIDQGASALGLKVVPVEVLEDSRCPADAECVQAGTVSVRTLVTEGDTLDQEEIFVLETPVTVGDYTVELVGVEPAAVSGEEIAAGDYSFFFEIVEM